MNTRFATGPILSMAMLATAIVCPTMSWAADAAAPSISGEQQEADYRVIAARCGYPRLRTALLSPVQGCCCRGLGLQQSRYGRRGAHHHLAAAQPLRAGRHVDRLQGAIDPTGGHSKTTWQPAAGQRQIGKQKTGPSAPFSHLAKCFRIKCGAMHAHCAKAPRKAGAACASGALPPHLASSWQPARRHRSRTPRSPLRPTRRLHRSGRLLPGRWPRRRNGRGRIGCGRNRNPRFAQDGGFLGGGQHVNLLSLR